MRIKFTEAEIKKMMNNLTIIIDGREQKADQYKRWYDNHNLKYIDKEEAKKMRKAGFYSLSAGDYSAMLPIGSIPGFNHEIWFDKDIVIEKKGSLKELAGNLAELKGTRVQQEFLKLQKDNTKVYIFLEDNLFHKHIREGKEKHIGLWNKETLYRRIKDFEAEYGTVIVPIAAEYMAAEIYHTLYAYVFAILKRRFLIGNERVKE